MSFSGWGESNDAVEDLQIKNKKQKLIKGYFSELYMAATLFVSLLKWKKKMICNKSLHQPMESVNYNRHQFPVQFLLTHQQRRLYRDSTV